MKKSRSWYVPVLVSVLCLCACRDGLSPQEYAHWIEDPANGLNITKNEKGYRFTLNYQPIEYIVAMQLRQSEIPEKVLKEEINKMEDLQYYTFKLSTQDGKPVFSGDSLNFPEKMIYLLSGMQKDMVLLEGADSLPCKLFHFEEANGVLPYDNCVMAFERSKGTQQDKTFLYRADKLGIDWVKIPVKAAEINKIPKLKTI
jgi:hypothetical protein